MPTSTKNPSAARFATNDTGNAGLFLRLHGDRVRFVQGLDRWRTWSGRHWAEASPADMDTLTYDVSQKRLDAAYELHRPVPRREQVEWALASSALPRRHAMLAEAASVPGISSVPEDYDHDPFLFNCHNGTLDLRTGELRPHEPKDMLSRFAPVDYDPEAQCPRWQQFLREVFQGDEAVMAYAQRLVGYLLTADTREQAAFFFVGKGANGKTVFVETLRALLGSYAADAPVSAFTTREAHAADFVALLGTRFVTVSETGPGQRLHEPLLKRLTGGDLLTCRRPYRENLSFSPTFKLGLVTNHLPQLSANSHALRRRVRVLAFPQTFYAREEGVQPVRDETLRQTLSQELPGILAWAVQGCLAWQHHGLHPPAEVLQETAAHLDELDPLADFLAERCLLDPRAQVPTGLLWQAYLNWCQHGHRPPAFKAPHILSRHLMQRDGVSAVRTNSARYLVGLRLLPDAVPTPDHNKLAIDSLEKFLPQPRVAS